MTADYENLTVMKDDDDIPDFTDEELENIEGVTGMPGEKHMFCSIDGSVFRYFEGTGKGYLNRMNKLINSLLKDYVSRQIKGGDPAID